MESCPYGRTLQISLVEKARCTMESHDYDITNERVLYRQQHEM